LFAGFFKTGIDLTVFEEWNSVHPKLGFTSKLMPFFLIHCAYA